MSGREGFEPGEVLTDEQMESLEREGGWAHIKANLPSDESAYLAGNGEGCWFLVDPDTKRAYDDDSGDETYFGILANDSCYYKGLRHGTVLPLEMRGSCRPVVPFRHLAGGWGDGRAGRLKTIAEMLDRG